MRRQTGWKKGQYPHSLIGRNDQSQLRHEPLPNRREQEAE
jgi:hypothetical protein